MTENITWDGEHLTVRVDAAQPVRCCGGDFTMSPGGITDEHGHAVAYVHLSEHVTAFAALHVIHALHAPAVEDFAPYCPICQCPSPCETRRATTAAMEVRP